MVRRTDRELQPYNDIVVSKNDVGEQERLLPCIIRLMEVDTLVELHKKLP